ncbi:hypothetical protein Celaphus_00003657 [Cervus elaphus hippelaphus]|uniref:Large ribosomal subunit protein uL22 n=1 Tax=Cervus elaphus hippelaphus TaxID=46360 RepID=A0A212D084_CEREH|nr:hypothetical protein Celaphus_00003657 [Cervus elaphus hippelaphus]
MSGAFPVSSGEIPTKSCKSRSSNVCVHFKNTREATQAVKGMHIREATKYQKDVTLKKLYAKHQGWTQGQWPKRSTEFLLHVLKNAESSAELKGLDVDSLLIEHIQVNKASSLWGRT